MSDINDWLRETKAQSGLIRLRPAAIAVSILVGASLAAQAPATGQRPIDALLEVPRLDASIRIASLKRQATPIRSVMSAIAGITRLNAHYDQSVPELDNDCNVDLVDASLENALQVVLHANAIAFTVLGPKEVFVYSDTSANRQKYPWSVRAFQVMHADPSALTALLYRETTDPGIRPVIVVAQSPSRTITVRATVGKMAVVSKLIADNDKR